ncbi:hypothetical protein [Streptomyces sp. NPDC058451]|uniref:hypothetical protein n=1 Tax=Streptomyces sp. NPDC058451 TaxID=3346506 RepID=UPI00364D61FF
MDSLAGCVACVWETKILFSAGDGMGPTLLTSDEPVPPDTDDEPCMKLLHKLKKQVADFAAAATRNARAARTPAEQLVFNQLASTHAGLDLSSAKLARQAIEQAGLANGPVQSLVARQAAEHAKLVNGPMQQLARRMAANQAAMYKAMTAPGLRLAQQAVAAQMAAAMPQLRLDLPDYAHQPRSGGDEAHLDEAEQTGQQKASGPDTPESEPDPE